MHVPPLYDDRYAPSGIRIRTTMLATYEFRIHVKLFHPTQIDREDIIVIIIKKYCLRESNSRPSGVNQVY